MKINRIKLLEALNMVGAVTGKRTTLPILNHVRIESKSGKLQIFGTDLDCSIVLAIDCNGDMGAICVPHALLRVFTEGASGEYIAIESDGQKISCTADNSEAGISCLAAEEFPPFPNKKETAVGINTIDVADAIRSTAWACVVARDAEPREASVCLNVKDNVLTCKAFDRKTLAYFRRPTIAAELNVLLPAQRAKLALEFLKQDEAVLCVGEDSMSIKCRDCSFHAVLLNENYFSLPDELILDRDPIGQIPSADLISSLSMCLMDTDLYAPVKFSFSKDGIGLEHQNGRFAFRKTLQGNYRSFGVKLDGRRLLPALKFCGGQPVSAFTLKANGEFGFQVGDTSVMIAKMKEV